MDQQDDTYFRDRDNITVQSDLLVKENRLVTPNSLRQEVLWTPRGVQVQRNSNNISVAAGTECLVERRCGLHKLHSRTYLKSGSHDGIPAARVPMQRMAANLCELKDKRFVVVVYYYPSSWRIADSI